MVSPGRGAQGHSQELGPDSEPEHFFIIYLLTESRHQMSGQIFLIFISSDQIILDRNHNFHSGKLCLDNI